MKIYVLLFALVSSSAWALSIKGQATVESSCQGGKVMMWLSKDAQDFAKKILLMHTEVPEQGTFEFYVKPGEYLVVGSNEKGCSFQQVVKVSDKDVTVAAHLKEKKP